MENGLLRRATDNRQYPRDSARIRAVSYFSGCGGLDLGFLGGFTHLGKRFKRNPVSICAAYDIDRRSVETYNRNVGHHAEVRDLEAACPHAMPTADLLLAGFPCQEFSACGPRKGLKSSRGQLYQAMIRYAGVHRPKIILGENVLGLLRLNRGRDLDKIQSDFSEAGYRCVRWEMHAQDYGVPQARHRIFLVFVRNDLPTDPVAPKPKRAPQSTTARAALDDLLLVEPGLVPNQEQYFKAQKAARGHGQGDETTIADAPAYTVRANSRSRVQFHYSEPRRLTVRECARLQTFPDRFLFPFDATANMSQIGNAVPPVLAHSVARSIVSYLLKQEIRMRD